MLFQEIIISQNEALELSQFKEMDYYAVEHYGLPIELMMENVGLQLAKLIAASAKSIKSKILIGVGNGNNGGGGLVAARRLAAWGYPVHLDGWIEIDKALPKKQLERAIRFGVNPEAIPSPDIWVDAYLGFSQRLPLQAELNQRIKQANHCSCHRIALDIPTGFLGDPATLHFHADQVLSLAAAKKILYHLPKTTEILLADLGIPSAVYQKFGSRMPPFEANSILKLKR